ncbi:MAG: ribonuclease D [Colwellia sp.]|nr:ribonuclease D [Colwellia sp.]
MNKTYIEDHASLVELCQKLATADVLAIDTEFVRTRTLYPKLGLIQVNDGENLALIDPVAVDDLSPFWQLLTDEKICKVLHACSEDLEVFLTAANCRPVNLIDSQIMMSFLGHGLSMGYAAMVSHYLDIEVDKSESRTDWMKRPLTAKQLDYAQADVDYLFQLYPRIYKTLEQKGWLDAAKQESELLIEKKFTPIDESKLYRNIKLSWKLSPKQLYLLQYLASWRFQQAKSRDMPIGFIAKDHTLFALAVHNPDNVGIMANLEGVEMLDVRHKGKSMLMVLKRAGQEDRGEYPERILRLDEYPGYKQIFKKVKTFIAEKAEKIELLPENLASKKQINQFLSWHFKLNNAPEYSQTIDILTGWRKGVFGNELSSYANNDFK